jgi:hypothetical protein
MDRVINCCLKQHLRQNVKNRTTWYVVLAQVVCIPFLFWILVVFFSYFPAGLDLMINDYRTSSLSLKKATLGTAISLGTTSLATLVFLFLNLSNEPLLELLTAVKYMASGLLTLLMYRMEKKVNYLILPSRNKVPGDVIDSE